MVKEKNGRDIHITVIMVIYALLVLMIFLYRFIGLMEIPVVLFHTIMG